MILEILREDFFKHKITPLQLQISFETYCEMMMGDRAMESAFRTDNEGKLGVNISGCPIYVVNNLDTPYKWLVPSNDPNM